MKNITYISAGAGSGKTHTLTTLLAALISKDTNNTKHVKLETTPMLDELISKDTHVEPEQVILTTFTVKAANEFKEKAKAKLYEIGKYNEASRLDKALIGTIDSVATQLIQKYWYTIGLSPKLVVMDDNAKSTYINQSIANIPTKDDLRFFEEFRKTFNVVGSYSKPNYNFWKDHLKEIVEKSISFDITDYSSSIEESLKILRRLCNGKHIQHLEYKQRLDILDKARAIVEKIPKNNKGEEPKNKINTLEKIESLQKSSYYKNDISWFAEFDRIVNDSGAPKEIKNENETNNEIIENARTEAKDLWCTQEVYDLQGKYIKTIFQLAKKWNEQYKEYKRNKGIVDFCDIEHYMHQLLQDTEVAAEIGRTYTHLFVDEFQDCSPIQVKIFMKLAEVVDKSYWVGDTKQAIYGFRASDTELTNAVANAIAQKQGADNCETYTLKESWRSVPPLVDTCNKAFIKIFEPVFHEKTEELVELKSAMELHPEKFKINLANRAKEPLRYLNITEKQSNNSLSLRMDGLAQYVKNVIKNENVELSDIAVLGRKNTSLDKVQKKLEEYGIICDRETKLNTDSKACQLMLALTTLTVNPYDDLAKAKIAYLTQDDMGLGAIIDSKLEYDNTPKEEGKTWLGEAEMIRRVNTLRESVKYQGIGALMETLAVELDVKNIMERWPTLIEKSMAEVKAFIVAAKKYEKHCGEVAQPATPSGFMAYLGANEVTIPICGNGVQLMTYHGAKGLEWKYVFMLLDETLEREEIMKKDFYGVHHFHSTSPSAENLYPQISMSIRLLPWIFGSRKYVPDAISNPLLNPDFNDFNNLEKLTIEESSRLLYVGMTRAAEVLVLVPWFEDAKDKKGKKRKFYWFKRTGLDNAGNIDSGDILGIGVEFTVGPANLGDNANTDSAPESYRRLNYYSNKPSEEVLRAINPSRQEGKSDSVKIIYQSKEFIKINSSKLDGRDYSEVGNCIHNVFAAIEHLNEAEVRQLVSSHGLDDVLPNADEIIRAWNNLQTFLNKEYGDPIATYHERPFRSMQTNGCIVTGSIDYVYQTKEGVVLIDFKTFPQVENAFKAVTAPTSDHYAGKYAGQLNTYAEALTAAGEKVISRLIYYPVSGLLVEIK